MGIKKLFIIKIPFGFSFQIMGFFIRVCWVSLFTSLFTLFDFISQCVFRFQEKFITQKRNSNFLEKKLSNDGDVDGANEDESDSFLRFRFPTYEEFIQNNDVHSIVDPVLCENSNDKVHVGTGRIAKTDDNFSSLKEIVEPQISSGTVGNSVDEFLHVRDVTESSESLTRKHSVKNSLEIEASQRNAFNVLDGDVGENLEECKAENGEEMSHSVNDSTNNEEILKNSSQSPSDNDELMNESTNNEGVMNNNTHCPSDDESLVSDFDSDSMVPSSMSSFRSSFIDSLSDGFLSDIDFERAFEVDTYTEFGWKEMNSPKEFLTEEDLELQNLNKGYETEDFEDEDEDILEELKILESELEGDNGTLEEERAMNMENEQEHELNAEKPNSGEQLSSDSEEQNGLETQWEHQDLVEQLKMEIKKVRAIGLPTILEESESPKIMDDLKPWKIEEKYQHEDTMDELHKFYKSYRERMRKLDILNYQKMYAIGFLRLKDPLQSFTKNKFSTPALATIVSLDCWPCKPKSLSEIHQPVMKKYSKELESELEMVYVGQMCLSWEFLRWEYGKALDLWESDPHGMHRYNEVTDKFQTFQVLLTRFLEDEPFQGPRIQHYVKNRCVLQNLLQVPLIRDDNTKDRKKEKKMVSSKGAITSVQLVEIMEASIRILWQFIRADRDTTNAVLLKCRRRSSVELQDPADASLLAEVRSSLQKKEKKLKELSRSENCILRKIQKHHHQQEDDSDHVLYFFSQVDLRLVSRVLNMSRITTEQLHWCSEKLSKIRFFGKKLHVEPSVLLFPCS